MFHATGASDFLVKPLDLHDLRRVLTRVFEDRRTRERARRAVEEEASGSMDALGLSHDLSV